MSQKLHEDILKKLFSDNSENFIKNIDEHDLYIDLCDDVHSNCFIFRMKEKKYFSHKDLTIAEYMNGTIFNIDNLNVYSYNYGPVINYYNISDNEKNYVNEMAYQFDVKIKPAYDGIYLRLSYIENDWYMSTTNKANSYNNKFMGDKSIGEMTDDVFTYDLELLNKDCIYYFILIHKDHNNVVYNTENKLYHISTYNKITDAEDTENDSNNIFKDIHIDNIDMNINDVLSDIKYKTDFKLNTSGYLVEITNNTDKYYYIYNYENFLEAKSLRHDDTKIEYLLIKYILNIYDLSNINMFFQYFPQYKNLYNSIVDNFYNMLKRIYLGYVQIYIKRLKYEKIYYVKFLYDYNRDYKETSYTNVSTLYNYICSYNILCVYKMLNENAKLDHTLVEN